MKQNMTATPAQKLSFHSRAAAATVTDVLRPPLTTAGQYDHVAAAAYLMKHTGTTALMVVNAQTGQLAGIITQADVARTIADGKDLNDVRVYHCPCDMRDRVRTNPTSDLAYATYSIPNYLAGQNAVEQQMGSARKVITRASQLWRPAENYVTLEEADPRGLNIGSWVMRLDSQQWVDVLTVWHFNNGTIAYADGHAALHVWTDRRTVNMSRDQIIRTDATNNPDFQYLRQRWDEIR